MLRSLPVMLSFNVGMILSDFFVFVFLFAWWETGRDISVIGGQLCARPLWLEKTIDGCAGDSGEVKNPVFGSLEIKKNLSWQLLKRTYERLKSGNCLILFR